MDEVLQCFLTEEDTKFLSMACKGPRTGCWLSLQPGTDHPYT